MGQWTGAARSNYVAIEDMEGLEQALAPFDIRIQHEGHPESLEPVVCFLDSEFAESGWPSLGDNDEEFDFAVHVMPYVKEGDVLVVMEVGHGVHGGQQYITGWVSAYHRIGGNVRRVSVSLYDIYKLIADEFGVDTIN